MQKRIYIESGILIAILIGVLASFNSKTVYIPYRPSSTIVPTHDKATSTEITASSTAPQQARIKHSVAKNDEGLTQQATSSNSSATSSKAPNEAIFYEFIAQRAGTVLEAMNEYAETHHFEFKTKEYPSLGEYVESINGLEAAKGYYWILYINWKDSAKGASTARVEKGDAIEWKYEKSY